jgi:hypothetical protein
MKYASNLTNSLKGTHAEKGIEGGKDRRRILRTPSVGVAMALLSMGYAITQVVAGFPADDAPGSEAWWRR